MYSKNIICVLFLFVVFSGKAQTAQDSAIIVNIQWEINPIEKGIVHKRAIVNSLYGGHQYINIVEIDTKSKHQTKVIMTNPSQITSEAARANHAIVAINGSYYDEKTGEPVCYYRIGKNVIDTTHNIELYRVTGAIHIQSGKVKLIPWNKEIEQAYNGNKGIVFASGPLLINKGSICDVSKLPNQKFFTDKHPRSAIALTENNKMLLVTVDGRQPQHAIGVSIPELTHLLKILGSKDALNLDGGRSTTLWSAKEKNNGVLNSPAANKKFDQFGERLNANTIIVTK